LPKITYVHDDGSRDVLDVPEGTSVMQAAVGAGIDGIVAECGGNMMCATCHVYVDPAYLDRLPAVSEEEDEMLDGAASSREDNSRLSCQLPVSAQMDGLIVTTPDRQR
jgi:2Fe-2S ferredoxin